MEEVLEIGPQPGPQTQFLSTTAEIAFYGGAAGAGKSYALLLEPVRHVGKKRFAGVVFRREGPEITNPGGLQDESMGLYPMLDGNYNQGLKRWKFPSGAHIKLSHMQHEADVYKWKGSALVYIGFDEVTTFTFKQFFYMLSRNRSMSGIKGYIRGTCNPDPDSWVAKFISWYIDDNGFPIAERSGVIRWFVNIEDQVHWGDSREELVSKFGKDAQPKSFTFIAANLFDNKIFMDKDPTYLSNLLNLPKVDKERLLNGNWKIRPAAGMYFSRSNFKIIERNQLPANRRIVRYWDRAATEQKDKNNPDWTVGLKLSESGGNYYVEHVERFRENPTVVEQKIKNIAASDTKDITIWLEVDPGQAGKFEANYYVKQLAGYTVELNPVSQSKIVRAGPVSSQVGAGNVFIVRDHWNENFITELENFPDGDKMDQVDAFSGAFNMLAQDKTGSFGSSFDVSSGSGNMSW